MVPVAVVVVVPVIEVAVTVVDVCVLLVAVAVVAVAVLVTVVDVVVTHELHRTGHSTRTARFTSRSLALHCRSTPGS